MRDLTDVISRNRFASYLGCVLLSLHCQPPALASGLINDHCVLSADIGLNQIVREFPFESESAGRVIIIRYTGDVGYKMNLFTKQICPVEIAGY